MREREGGGQANERELVSVLVLPRQAAEIKFKEKEAAAAAHRALIFTRLTSKEPERWGLKVEVNTTTQETHARLLASGVKSTQILYLSKSINTAV